MHDEAGSVRIGESHSPSLSPAGRNSEEEARTDTDTQGNTDQFGVSLPLSLIHYSIQSFPNSGLDYQPSFEQMLLSSLLIIWNPFLQSPVPSLWGRALATTHDLMPILWSR